MEENSIPEKQKSGRTSNIACPLGTKSERATHCPPSSTGSAANVSGMLPRKLVHGQVTIIFVVSVCLFVCLFVCLCRVFLSRL